MLWSQLVASVDWGVHVAPPSVVRKIVPNGPTTVPVFAWVKKTLWSGLVVPLDCGVQAAPPSVIRRITPDHPTTVPVLPSAQETLRNQLFVPMDREVHVSPLTGGLASDESSFITGVDLAVDGGMAQV